MGDDLDDLLDEIEGELREKPKRPRTEGTNKKHYSGHHGGYGSHHGGPGGYLEDQELDMAIRDICADEQTSSNSLQNEGGFNRDKYSRSRHKETPPTSTSQPSTKCYSVLLGGSRNAMGCSTTTSQRACDKLRCTSCDFRVVYFDDYAWHSRSDYLFFRNNVPDFERLKKNLTRKKGCRAYACQCQWESVVEVVAVSSLSKLKWVCSKHS